MKEFDLVSTLGLIKLDSRFFHRGIIAQYLTTTEYSLADIRSDVVIRPGCVCGGGRGGAYFPAQNILLENLICVRKLQQSLTKLQARYRTSLTNSGRVMVFEE